MYRRPCQVRGCQALIAESRSYSAYCTKHKKAKVRHGHPEQTALGPYELPPFLKTVSETRARNPGSPAWPLLADRWNRLVSHAMAVLQAYEGGAVSNRLEVEAARYVRDVAGSATPDKVADTVLSVYLLRSFQPRRFKDERAFRFALVRRTRRLAPMSTGTYWNESLKRISRVYRDPAPRVIEVLSSWLVDVFGVAATLISDLEQRRLDEKAEERRQLEEVFRSLQ